MTASPWQLDNKLQTATVALESFSAQIALELPHAGWMAIQQAHRQVAIVPQRVCLADHTAAPLSPSGVYLRGPDLIATYLPRAQRPYTTQVYRRLWQWEAAEHSAVVMTTIVSLHTQLLDASARLALRTDYAVPPEEVLFSTESGFGEQPDPRCGTILVRYGDVSYAELVDPVDYCGAHFEADHCQRDFAEPLEKGVIRRLQVWGLLLSRDNDLSAAQAIQREFLHAPPPLTT